MIEVGSAEDYDNDLKLAEVERQKNADSRKIIKKGERKYHETRHARHAELCARELGFNTHIIKTFIGEIKPGSKNGMHRHMGEAAILILKGKGYSLIDDKRVNWEEGDVIFIPSMSWHQHFNTDATKPVEYYAATARYLDSALGIFYMEQREDQAGYKDPKRQ